MSRGQRHKVFISFHHKDQKYRDRFARMMAGDIVDKSVEDGDIDDTNLKTTTIRQKIRDEFISDATVTVVLIGPCTWQRKHVDWEIGASLRKTRKNSRCGLLGIILPAHPDYADRKVSVEKMPPRLADNWDKQPRYASVIHWTDDAKAVRRAVNTAFARRDTVDPDNSRQQFKNNRSGRCSLGWNGQSPATRRQQSRPRQGLNLSQFALIAGAGFLLLRRFFR